MRRSRWDLVWISQKKEDIRLIGAAAWRRRFFVLWTPKPPYDRKNSMIMYFEDEISCQKYFKKRSFILSAPQYDFL